MNVDEWQVAGRSRRCRRHRAEQPKPELVADRRGGRRRPQLPTLSGTNAPHRTGFSYTEGNKTKLQAKPMLENRVEEELRKLERLQILLKKSAFWERLVEGLESILVTLGLPRPLSAKNLEGEKLRSYPPELSWDTNTATNEPSPRLPQKYHFDESACSCSAGDRQASTGPTNGAHSIDTTNGRGSLSQQRGYHGARAETLSREVGVKGAGEVGLLNQRSSMQCHLGGALKGLCELVCYGIGNFSESNNARYQFALALCLRELLFPAVSGGNGHTGDNCDGVGKRYVASAWYRCSQEYAVHHGEDSVDGKLGVKSGRSDGGKLGFNTNNAAEPVMLLFDPVMGEIERAILAKLGCGVIEINEQGKRCCCGPIEGTEGKQKGLEARCRPTLFFMPHCPMRLYSNLLWANWSAAGARGATGCIWQDAYSV